MHKSRLAALVIDSNVADIQESVTFWARALGYPAVESDADWSEKYVHLKTPQGQPEVLIQKVAHPSRVHLDIETDDIQAEVARLKALGAEEVEVFPRWTVMRAPSGHQFCVVKPQRGDFNDTDEINHWP